LDQQDLLDPKEHLEIQDQLDHKASLATKDPKDFWVHRVLRELQAHRVKLVNLVKLDQQDLLVRQEFRVGLDPLARSVQRGHQEYQEGLEFQVQLVIAVPQD